MFSFQSALQKRWRHGQCPILNGVVLESGEVRRLDVRFGKAGSYHVEVRGAEVTSLEQLSRNRNLWWIHVMAMAQVAVEAQDLVVCAGETSYGNEGFVAVARASDGFLHRLLHLEDSNPFVSIELSQSGKNQIVAVTNSGVAWTLALALETLDVLAVAGAASST